MQEDKENIKYPSRNNALEPNGGLLWMFWVRGYLYIIIAIIIYTSFACTSRFGIYDWTKELNYFQYIRESIVSYGELPYVWWHPPRVVDGYPAVHHTTNFIGNPETMLFSPFTPLLYWVDVVPYIKMLVVIHLLIGIIGMFSLKRRLMWDDTQFRIYAALFLLSPVVIQHLGIGYTPWLNLFFFPWLVVFMTDRRPLISIIGSGAVLAIVFLQGGTHVGVWFGCMMVLYGIICSFLSRSPGSFLCVAGALVVCAGLAWVRIASTVMAYADFHQPMEMGMNLTAFLFWGLTPPIPLPDIYQWFLVYEWNGVPSWDAGVFWGGGLIFCIILVFNYIRYREILRNNSADGIVVFYDAILLSSIIMFFISFGRLYEWIIEVLMRMDIPFSGVEKYPFRWLIPACMGFALVVSGYAQLIFRTIEDREIVKRLRIGKGQIEAMLVVPLIAASCFWLIVCNYKPYDKFVVDDRINAPDFEADYVANESVVAEPAMLRIGSENETCSENVYKFPDIPMRDKRFLDVTSGNGRLSSVAGKFAVVREGPGRIVIEVNRSIYQNMILVTAWAWIVATLVFILSCKSRLFNLLTLS